MNDLVLSDLSGENADFIKLKRELESKGMKQIEELTKTKSLSPETVEGVMLAGAKEFVDKMGRNMTYSEIREIYG